MKKLIYYPCLFITWFIILLLFSAIFALVGITDLRFGWGYALSSGFGMPFLWIISAGITMLLRRFWYKIFFKEEKLFKKDTAVMLIIFGTSWMVFTVVPRMLVKSIEKDLIESYEQKLNE